MRIERDGAQEQVVVKVGRGWVNIKKAMSKGKAKEPKTLRKTDARCEKRKKRRTRGGRRIRRSNGVDEKKAIEIK